MESDVFETTKQQITKVQLWIGQHNLKFERLRTPDTNYIPPSIFFQLRDKYEALRISTKVIHRMSPGAQQFHDRYLPREAGMIAAHHEFHWLQGPSLGCQREFSRHARRRQRSCPTECTAIH